MQQRRHEAVCCKEAMAAVFVIIGGAVVVAGVARSRVVGVGQRHVAFATFDRGARVAFVVPVAGSPVVILVLQLYPSHAVHFLINELLVAGSAILRFLVHALPATSNSLIRK